MNRRHFLIAFGSAALVAGSPAIAATFEESVVSQLKGQGYRAITVERTLLGRVKIVGQLDAGRREIILNPRTGEILRDLWITKSGGVNVPKIRDKSDNDDNSGHDNGGDDNGGDDNGGDDGDSGEDNDSDDDDDDNGDDGDDN